MSEFLRSRGIVTVEGLANANIRSLARRDTPLSSEQARNLVANAKRIIGE
jgi:hypothetical protein